MAENEEVQEASEVEVVEEPYESESARYIRIRKEAKEQAAVTMAAEAKAAQKAKLKRTHKSPDIEGLAEFHKVAAEIEKSINAKPDDKKEDS